jgi:hypothetical protein
MRAVPAQLDPKRDEPVQVPLDPEEALRALLQVKPEEDDQKMGALPSVKTGILGAERSKDARSGR